jgi:DNA-binding LacI/PurR family transcriptional regulator
LIGIVAMGSPLFGIAQHVIGVERAARERGFGTVVVTTSEHESTAEVRPAVERALEMGAEGVVVVEPFWRDPAVFDPLADVPLVCALQATTGRPRHASVVSAEEDGGRLATEHLLSLGHTRVAHISGPPSWRPALQREEGWRAALAEAGLPAIDPLRGDWSARSGYEAAQQMLLRSPGVTAVFAGNDAMAIGAIRAFAEAGLRVPHDVAIVGFDDLPESGFQMVPLSTVRQNFELVASLSVEQLVRAIEGGPSEQRDTVVPCRLVVRSSATPRAPSDDSLRSLPR